MLRLLHHKDTSALHIIKHYQQHTLSLASSAQQGQAANVPGRVQGRYQWELT